ncbi:cobyrinic acid a,c-diamide synthase [Novosphingobium sediminis]|uniref:Cobyrinic acid a,c-diamide synthase n=1 Tax=Novosphingobium sediminis TaxID=707214 RepID=A0A512APX3_9SPHN|nr:ParA family protein [Novosphingobium sediminis]GEO01730.1 cobyrinic acid a,c-diamide synthase [Novosphingobium sediminis]
MAVIAVYSVKGGVGKTTLAVDMAWRSATLSGHPTLLWDLDPQGGAGWLLGLPDRNESSAASVFRKDSKPGDLITPTRYSGLAVLQADESMRSLPATLARIGKRKRLARTAAALSGAYERIIIDCPPAINEISEQVFAAADLLIVPLPPSPLSARALPMIQAEILANHPRHPPILPVLSMYDARRKLHRDVHAGFAAGWPVIPMASAIEQTAARRAPIGTFAASGDVNGRLQRL